MRHLAILDPHFIALLLDGTKTVEARLLKTRRPPFGCVKAWDTVYLKPKGQPMAAVGTVRWIRQRSDLTPDSIEQLRVTYDRAVCAPDEFWEDRMDAKHAVIIRLDDVRQLEPNEVFEVENPSPRDAWVCIDRVEAADTSTAA